MSNTNKKIAVAIDIDARMTKAQQSIEALKNQIGQFDLSKSLSTEFIKEFKTIEREFVELKRRAADGEINLFDANAAEKSMEKIEKRWAFLVSKIGQEGFLEKGLKLDAQAMAALQTVQDSYNQSMKDTEARHSRLNKNLEKAKQHQQELLEIQKQQTIVSQAAYDTQRQKTEWAERDEKAAKKARDEAEKNLRNKIAESNGKYSMEDVTKKGSNLRKTDAYKEYAIKNAAYEEAKKKSVTEKSVQSKMTTKGLQAEEAEKAEKAINEATNALEVFRKVTLETAKTNAFKASLEALTKMEEFKDVDFSQFGIDLSQIKNAEELEKVLAKLRVQAGEKTTKAFKKMEDSAEEITNEFNGMSKEIDEAKDSLKELSNEAQVLENFEANAKRFLGMAGAVEVFRKALSSAFNTIKELDLAMTEMAVVTDLDIGDYWDQLPEHTSRAQELGVAIKDVYEAETLYYQQGLKTNEVVALSNETLKMARIAGLSAEDATNKMTAALRGFNMELNETSAKNVADVYSELAAITAADVEQISSAMSKTASIASSAGMEFETTAAFLSQIIETTQESAETAGTALKTVIARFQELKKDPSEIGEVDGEIVDANAIEKALRSVGVSLRDTSGQFRDLDDVFLELSQRWGSLDKNTQRYIATIAAGSRQQSRFLAMMSDYGRTQELVAAANNSSGASQEQFTKTLESLSVKLERLKAAWEEFTMGILESDLVKFGVDVLTKFLEIINKATSAFNGLGGSIVKVLSIITLFKLGQKVFEKLKQPFFKFFKDLTKMTFDAGYEAGKAYAQGGQKAKEEMKSKTSKTQLEEKEEEKKPRKTLKEKAFDKIGITNFEEARANFNSPEKKQLDRMNKVADKKTREQNVKKAKKGLADAEVAYRKDPTNKAAETAYNNAKKKAELANNQLERYNKTEQKVQKQSAEGWKQVGEGISSAGKAVAGLGIGVSLIGGLLSSMGLDEVGDTISAIGNGIMIVGSAISMIGSLVPAVAAILKTAGASTAAAWGWVALIAAAVMVLIAAVVIIFQQINNNSPEKKLENAQKAAEGAAEGADKAAESFENLRDSLDSLSDQYNNLDNLIKGTEEWNKAVQETNSSVLDLIDKYPELAGLVENEGGVLTLDVDSAEVADILKSYEINSIKAKNAELGAKINLSRAQADYELDTMDDDVFEKFQTAGQDEAVDMATLNTIAATGVGAASGAGIGAALGSIVPGFGTAIGAGVGAIVGAVSGLVGGIATWQYTVDQVEKSNEVNRENVETLAQAYANGETGETVEEIARYVERNGIAVGDAAVEMAEALVADAETMKEFGDTLNKTDEQQKAYYQAMAINAQSFIDMGSMNEQAQNQINTVVDEDLMKDFEEAERERLTKEIDGSNSEEFEKQKEAYAKSVYGANARVDGDQILDEKGEVVREFTDDESWINEIAAANATEKAAAAMLEIPGAILNSIRELEPALQDVFMKAFEGKSLTRAETDSFVEQMGTVTYKNADGTTATAWEDLDQATKDVWETEEKYLKSLDADYSGIDDMWNELTDAQKKAYGWNGDKSDTASLEKAKEAYEDTFTEIQETNTKAFQAADDAAEKMGITFSSQLSAVAAQSWTKSLETVYLGAAEGEIKEVNAALTELLTGLTNEQTEWVMTEINAMDKMDISAWDDLGEALNNLNIDYNTEALLRFTEAGKLAYNAIEKIDFSTLSDDVNDIYKTINKVKEGSRTYSEDDYKEIIAANKSLEKAFTQIGDDFIYVGGSMEDLIDALEKNTLAKLKEANRQLKVRSEMAGIVATESRKYGNVDAMGKMDLLTYLTNMRQAFADASLDIADLGIQGLSGTVDFSKVSLEDLQSWAQQIAAENGKKPLYDTEYQKQLEEANVQRYTYNEASYNARMAVHGGEYAKQHQEALILQGIQSGVVANSTIEAYQAAIKDGNNELIESIGEDIAKAADEVVKASEGRDAYGKLIEQVEEALINTQQKAIDKLADINDSVNEANERLITAIQEQISKQRQEEELKESEQELSNLYAQQTYLNADSSGANALASLQLGNEIKDAEKDLEETYIDQAIQQLQDANEQAAEQRERQIALMESQLDQSIENGEFYRQASEIVSQGLLDIQNGTTLDTTKMYEVLFGDSGSSLSGIAAEDWSTQLKEMATKAINWYENQDKPVENVTENDDTTEDGSSPVVNDYKGQTKNNALAAAKDALSSKTGGGYIIQSEDKNSEFYKAWESYKTIDPNISKEDFADLALKGTDIDKHKYDFKVLGTAYEDKAWAVDFVWEEGKGEEEDGWINVGGKDYEASINGTDNDARAAAVAQGLANNQVFKYGKGYYIYHDDLAYKLTRIYSESKEDWVAPAFKTGGLADFTGPAWLDGTKARPEMVLNARDTQNFIQLKDILAEILEGTNHITNNSQSKENSVNTFDIDINVEGLKDDYDVEQLADKIRSMLYNDATFRNVNNVSLKR